MTRESSGERQSVVGAAEGLLAPMLKQWAGSSYAAKDPRCYCMDNLLKEAVVFVESQTHSKDVYGISTWATVFRHLLAARLIAKLLLTQYSDWKGEFGKTVRIRLWLDDLNQNLEPVRWRI